MGADQVSFIVRFAERKKTDNWTTVRHEVANYIAGIFEHLTPEKSYYNNLQLAVQGDKAVDYLIDYANAFKENKKKDFCEISIDEYYGRHIIVWDGITKGLNQYYPNIDWEFHEYVRYAAITDRVVISVSGRLFRGSYEIVPYPDEDLLEEEYREWEEEEDDEEPPPKSVDEWLEQYDFSVPKPTEENPYPIPKFVLEKDLFWEKAIVWCCDSFRGDVGSIEYKPITQSKVSQSEPLSHNELQTKAEAGDAAAQYDLGSMLIHGKGVETDVETGLEWLKKAAAQGNQKAAEMLKGIDIPDLYYVAAMSELGKKGLSDKEKYFRLIKKAAEGGQKNSESKLGEIYILGIGTEWNYDKGIELLREATKKGNILARSNLMRFSTPDAMCFSAMIKIAINLKAGLTDSADYKHAFELLNKAAEKGSAIANSNLGFYYVADQDLLHLGIKQDKELAKTYIRKAAELNDEYAKTILKAVEENEEAKSRGEIPNPVNMQIRIPKLN